ncbi:MAG: amidase [Pararhodobacter sp.]|nr:amidase [Pararhodobacter sp.]
MIKKNHRVPTIRDLRRLLHDGAITAADIRQAVAEQMDKHRGLNAIITPMLDDGDDVDMSLPLAGVPIGIKDFFDTQGVRTTAGHHAFADRIPVEDAELVRRLKAAGAMIVVKTNMHALGMGTTSLDSHFGPVGNPWRADLVAGGSSGGSAAAIASGICFATVDTDAIGSARLTAACCAVTGFKPTSGVLSQAGILDGITPDPAIIKLSHAAIQARCAADVELLLPVLFDAPMAPGMHAPRLGVATNFSADEAAKAAFGAVLARISALAPSWHPVDLPFAEARFDAAGIDEERAGINARLFADVDLIALPTLANPVLTIAEAREQGDQAVSPANTFLANYFGLPAISIPVGFDRGRAPVGLQIIGPRGSDATVIAFARRVQQLFPPMLADDLPLPSRGEMSVARNVGYR